jgi:transcriptional regulator
VFLPKVFVETRIERLHALMQAHSFGTLVVPAEPLPEIAHVPFHLVREGAFGTLRAHVARANPVAKMAAVGAAAVAVFAGPHAYVTPRWYERRDEQVPTWNYAVVHAHGVLEPLGGPELHALLEDLSREHEGPIPDAWNPSELSPAFLAELEAQIVGFRLRIARIEGKYKLSQNRSPRDRAGVLEGLRERDAPGDRDVADLMDG